jgi:hypothetical protein
MEQAQEGAVQSTDSVSAAKGKEKYAAETAKAEFISYCDANDIDHDKDSMKDEDLKGFNQIEEHFIRACKAGRVTVDGTKIIYKVSERSGSFAGDTVTISRLGFYGNGRL